MCIVNTCKDCPNRHAGCHDTCETYKNFTDEVKKKKEWLKEQNGVYIRETMLMGQYKKNANTKGTISYHTKCYLKSY